MSDRCRVTFGEMAPPPNPAHGIKARDRKTGEEWTLGQILQKHRVVAGLSQREAAAALVKDPRWLNDVEHDRLIPTPQEFRGLAAQIGMHEGVMSALLVAVEMEEGAQRK